MSIQKIEPTTKVKDWVKRINYSFDEIRQREICWTTTSIAGIDEYEFPVSPEDRDSIFKDFDPSSQYSVQYGGVILVPEDYSLTGKRLKFVNGAPTEDGYPIIIRYIAKGEKQGTQQ